MTNINKYDKYTVFETEPNQFILCQKMELKEYLFLFLIFLIPILGQIFIGYVIWETEGFPRYWYYSHQNSTFNEWSSKKAQTFYKINHLQSEIDSYEIRLENSQKKELEKKQLKKFKKKKINLNKALAINNLQND